MPISKKKARKPGDTRTTSQPRKPVAQRSGINRRPDHILHTQVRGGRPPRFPGRTGGR
ncbi:hypothetical protein GCM10007385_22640 [Tateyamaria omphalii]|uniref:hypothetical protein n=1 Tax=Tateyamaria omphalii TaxID=299262 RepID=UPI001674ADD2|nr:hypothetical protein [Tateyamaria omphalii]GGX53925.1 hypothetical protein GCM10007385_22640 [Tateyamaria omphalii]